MINQIILDEGEITILDEYEYKVYCFKDILALDFEGYGLRFITKLSVNKEDGLLPYIYPKEIVLCCINNL